MYNNKLEALEKALTKAALEAKKVAENLAKEIAAKDLVNGSIKLESKEYAYSYIKDALDGVSRVKISLNHADIFLNESNK